MNEYVYNIMNKIKYYHTVVHNEPNTATILDIRNILKKANFMELNILRELKEQLPKDKDNVDVDLRKNR